MSGNAIVPRASICSAAPASAVPTFNAPERGLRNEGYFSNALYQLHRALTDPEVVFADAPAYWHRYNVHISDAQSQRFADTIWKALRLFENDPPMEDIDQGSRVYLRKVLGQFHTALPEFAQMAQSIFELNNQLMPTITITAGHVGFDAGHASRRDDHRGHGAGQVTDCACHRCHRSALAQLQPQLPGRRAGHLYLQRRGQWPCRAAWSRTAHGDEPGHE